MSRHQDNSGRLTGPETGNTAIRALIAAKTFIQNGVEFGRIMPDHRNDPDREVLPLINQALREAGVLE